ncbi:MAG TPA: HepT-like ribonuclease domain-containing protein [Verrucomicrobiae bacterium]|nr:HepT-like ribonuclease domain-containing protein [Verrucomicrobiae bacterium]
MRDDDQRLLDIREGIERIEKYSAIGRQEFDRNELVQTRVLHHLQIIGEAARSLSAECKARQLA